MRTLTAVLAALLVTPLALRAQDVTLGDRVRYRTDADSAWVEGRLMAVEDSSLSVAVGTRELHAELAAVQKAERWEPTNPAWTLLGSTVGMAAGWWVGGELGGDTDACDFDGADCPWITGSAAGDVGLAGGVGLVSGLVVWAVDRGDWKEWEIPAP